MTKRYLLTWIFLLLFAAVAFSQQLTQLSGTVTDPSGAVVPNATIRIESLTRGQFRETKSDSAGRYSFPQILPDKYRLTAKAAGFSDVIVNNVEALVSSPATVNIAFEKIGAIAEVVSVSAEAAQINTNDATLGNNFGSKPILQLPFEGRNVASLLSLQPGVTFIGDGEDVQGDYRQGSVAGGKGDQSNITLDGVDSNDQQGRVAFASALRVTLDSVQEFRVVTTNANADMGRSSGAQITLSTKSGTNDSHGSLYYFLRNKATNANNFFNNSAVSESSPNGIPLNKLNRNIYGGSIGGPIVKNRLFYFFNYEGRTDRREDSTVRIVPTDSLRNGFVKYLRKDGSIATLSPEEIKTRIDTVGIGVSPAALALFNRYPLPNDVTTGDLLNTGGYRFNAPVKVQQHTYITRLDYTLDQANKYALFFRGNLQNDHLDNAPQFPGLPPNSTTRDNTKGMAVGLNTTFSPSFISTTRFGFTRPGFSTVGIAQTPITTFRNLDGITGTGRSLSRVTPVYNITQDFSWNKGAHSIQFGGTLRWIHNTRRTDQNSWQTASGNRSWLTGAGRELNLPLTDMDPTFRLNERDAMVMALGVVTQGTARFNYTQQGDLLPFGTNIKRRFFSEEYEMYGQDTWRVARGVTITAGLRYSLMPPIYEADGNQVTSSFPLSDWFARRVALGNAGLSQEGAGKISYVLASSAQGSPLYEFHKKNVAPRFSIAWSPQANDGFAKAIFGGPGKTSIRAGWGMFYDLFGSGLITNFDTAAFGLTSSLTNPSGSLRLANAPRFTSFTEVPSSILLPAPKGGFPAVAPDAFAIINGLDNRLKAPYTMNMNFSIEREFKGNFFVQAAYVGRNAQRTLTSEDIAIPINTKDPGSGIDYFTAASYLGRNALAGTPTADMKPNPFWENMFPDLAGGGQTATQNAYDIYSIYAPDFTSALYDLDVACDPTCSKNGPFSFFNSQYSYLRVLRSIGRGNYHSAQLSVRKRWNSGDQVDLNYTWSKSIDLSSATERNTFGVILNPYDRRQFRAVSDYDMTHQFNANFVYGLPFGKGRMLGSGAGKVANMIIGGWQLSGLVRLTSGLPTAAFTGGVWPTNWNLESNTVAKQKIVTQTTKNAPAPPGGTSGPNMFADPSVAIDWFDYALPGGAGDRNNFRGDGLFNLDAGLAKRITMPFNEKHSMQLRWEVFNATNTVRFDPGFANLDISTSSTFGKYTSTLTNPRVMQFALRYEF